MANPDNPIGLFAIEGWLDSMKEQYPELFDPEHKPDFDKSKYSEYYKSSLKHPDEK